jgi:hypothetical protein
MGNEKVELNKEEDKEREKDSYINAAYLFIAVRLARETLSPIGSSISFGIGLFGVLVSPEDYRIHLIGILVAAAAVFVAYTLYQYNKLNQRCVDFPVQKRPARHFYTLLGGFQENMKYVMSEDRFKHDEYAFAMGIDQTLDLSKSTKKGILNSVLEMLHDDYKVDIAELQKKIDAEKKQILEDKKGRGSTETVNFGDIVDVFVEGEGIAVNKEESQKKAKIRLLLIVNSKKRYSDTECQDAEKFESVEGIDSRIIVIKLFEYCQKKNIQNMMMGAMGTNGLNFPLYVIVREIVNAYCYWVGQLSFDSTSPLNVILSLQKKDITRHAGELSKIISYIHWMIDRRKETITNKRNWAS